MIIHLYIYNICFVVSAYGKAIRSSRIPLHLPDLIISLPPTPSGIVGLHVTDTDFTRIGYIYIYLDKYSWRHELANKVVLQGRYKTLHRRYKDVTQTIHRLYCQILIKFDKIFTQIINHHKKNVGNFQERHFSEN